MLKFASHVFEAEDFLNIFVPFWGFWDSCSYKKGKMYFLLFYISFYISRYHFHKFLEFHSTLFEIKISVTVFPLLRDSLKPSNPLNSQNLQSVAKVFG